MIIGDSGTGKSRSILNLNSKETFIINVLNKPLPFRGSINKYSKQNKNICTIASYKEILPLLKNINDNALHIKNLIIDDAEFIMTTELFEKVNDKGYEKFTTIGLHMQQILSYSKDMRDDLKLAFLFHEDDVYSDKIKISKKVKTIGMMLEDKYNPVSVVSIALFTSVVFDDKTGKPIYRFVTNRTLVDGITIPSKSPEGMFDELYIPNDLEYVFRKIQTYYSSEVPNEVLDNTNKNHIVKTQEKKPFAV